MSGDTLEYHHWRLTTRTGETKEGEDDYPSDELKRDAQIFVVQFPCNQEIVLPDGQLAITREASIVIPDGFYLIFKRRVQIQYKTSGPYQFIDVNQPPISKTWRYIIQFERFTTGG